MKSKQMNKKEKDIYKTKYKIYYYIYYFTTTWEKVLCLRAEELPK